MKYDYFQDEKLEYENIEIPDELLLMVRQTVAADRRKKAMVRRMRILKTAGSIAAALFLCLTIGVNSSYAFAEKAVQIPIVKNVAKAVVVRSYREDIIAVYEENKVSSQSKKSSEEAPGQPPAEALPAESGNDVPEQTGTSEQPPAEQEPAEVLEGIEAWKAEMTPEKLREVTELYTPDMEIKYADTPEKLRTVLLAELPGKDISLYGYHENGETAGVALRIGDTHQYFDWKYMNESLKLPDLVCEDIDGDGNGEIVVSLYNAASWERETSREVLRAIPKENIAAPGQESGEKTGTSENAVDTKEKKAADTSDAAKPGAESGDSSNLPEESAEETAPAESTQKTDVGGSAGEKTETELPAVSDNDVKVQTESKREEVNQPAGELWVVSPKGESWSAAVLSTDDYESQILHQLKAAYDAQTGEIQLYLVEEPFGDPVAGPAKLTFEAVNVAPERNFTVKKGISLQFQMEVTLLKEDGERVYVSLEPKMGAEIYLRDNSLIIENIQEL